MNYIVLFQISISIFIRCTVTPIFVVLACILMFSDVVKYYWHIVYMLRLHVCDNKPRACIITVLVFGVSRQYLLD